MTRLWTKTHLGPLLALFHFSLRDLISCFRLLTFVTGLLTRRLNPAPAFWPILLRNLCCYQYQRFHSSSDQLLHVLLKYRPAQYCKNTQAEYKTSTAEYKTSRSPIQRSDFIIILQSLIDKTAMLCLCKALSDMLHFLTDVNLNY
jgi:hypothetical protein